MSRRPAAPSEGTSTERAHAGLDGYMSLRTLAAYSDMSVKALRHCLVDPTHPLPHFRMAHKILVKRSDFDAWIRWYRNEEPKAEERLKGSGRKAGVVRMREARAAAERLFEAVR